MGLVPILSFQDWALNLVVIGSKISDLVSDPIRQSLILDPMGPKLSI